MAQLDYQWYNSEGVLQVLEIDSVFAQLKDAYMDDRKSVNYKAAKRRDIFKRKHEESGGKLYATDVDFVWVKETARYCRLRKY